MYAGRATDAAVLEEAAEAIVSPLWATSMGDDVDMADPRDVELLADVRRHIAKLRMEAEFDELDGIAPVNQQQRNAEGD